MRRWGSGAHWAAVAGIALVLFGAAACMVAILKPAPPMTIIFESVPPRDNRSHWTHDNFVIYRDGHVEPHNGWGYPVVLLRDKRVVSVIATAITDLGESDCSIRVNGREVVHRRAETNDIAVCSWSPLR